MTDLDELRRIALAATPGPWRECGQDRGGCSCGMIWSTTADSVVAVAVSCEDEDYTGGEGFTPEQAKLNAAFIAAFNPSVALDLIHENAVLTRALSIVAGQYQAHTQVDKEWFVKEWRSQAEREIAKEQTK